MPAPAPQQSVKGFPAVTLDPERCLNAHHRGAGCTLCADSCPLEGTIAVIDGTPVLDERACQQCGLCLHLCPTGCFAQAEPRLDGLKWTLSNLPAGRVDLLCPHHPSPERGPSSQAVQTGRCLAALSPATLLEMAAGGREVELDDTPCSGCRLGGIHRHLEQAVTESGAWGRLLQGSAQVSLRSWQAELEQVEERPVHDAGRPLLSRRDLFSAAKEMLPQGTGARHAAAGNDPGQPDRAASSTASPLRALPPQRARLLTVLRSSRSSSPDPARPSAESATQSQSGLPMAEVIIDPDRCSACGLCARTCPTSAIGFDVDQNRFQLTFHPNRCLGLRCNLCRQACPEVAVSTKPASVDPEWLTEASSRLADGNLIPCRTCGAPVAAGPKRPPTCIACHSIPRKTDFSKSLKWS